MMNNTQVLTASVTSRELSFGSWKVMVTHSPKRICRQVVDFATGVRWAWYGAVAAVAAIVVIAFAQ